jgi:hypothetical protein
MGGTGLDFIRGGAGNDIIFGNEYNDRIISDQGDDTVDAGSGADVVRGGQGNDSIRGGYDVELDNDGNPIGTFNAADQLSGEVGNDTLYAWGGGSTMTGGGTIPQGESDEDTLVLVTGEATMTGGSQDDDYYVLANIRDDATTEASITGFNFDDDELFLTIDYDPAASTVPTDPEVEVRYEDVPSDGEFGSGTLVTVTLVSSNDISGGDYEGASVFLEGRTAASIEAEGANFKFGVYLTETASYDDPDATVAAIDTGTALAMTEFFPLPPAPV